MVSSARFEYKDKILKKNKRAICRLLARGCWDVEGKAEEVRRMGEAIHWDILLVLAWLTERLGVYWLACLLAGCWLAGLLAGRLAAC